MLKKIIVYIVGVIFFYFISVLVLFISTLVLNISLDNVWLIGVPVTCYAILILLINYLWKKYKNRKQNIE